MDLHFKVLSHRLRGLAEIEHSISGMKAACETDIPYFEVDTRADKDGCIYVYHDNIFTEADSGKKHVFSQSPTSEISELTYPNGEKLLTLDLALEIFKNSKPEQKFCIDIKDYGLEQEHLDLVRKHDLENKVVWVSWIPQTLIRLNELGTSAPVILSQWNLTRLSLVGGALTWVISKTIFGTKAFAVIGQKMADKPLDKYQRGYQHCYVAGKMPDYLIHSLSQNGGGICIHTLMVCPALIDYCREKDLKLWVFSAENTVKFRNYAGMDGVDVVFCDNALSVMEDLK